MLTGLSLLAANVELDLAIKNKSLAFTVKWVDMKFRERGSITNRDYSEFLAELAKIEMELKNQGEDR